MTLSQTNLSSSLLTTPSQDPNQELFLWAILSGRGKLARHLWERCNSPLTAAVVGSALYRALWRSLGAKNTEVRTRYHVHAVEFEKLGVRVSVKRILFNKYTLRDQDRF